MRLQEGSRQLSLCEIAKGTPSLSLNFFLEGGNPFALEVDFRPSLPGPFRHPETQTHDFLSLLSLLTACSFTRAFQNKQCERTFLKLILWPGSYRSYYGLLLCDCNLTIWISYWSFYNEYLLWEWEVKFGRMGERWTRYFGQMPELCQNDTHFSSHLWVNSFTGWIWKWYW